MSERVRTYPTTPLVRSLWDWMRAGGPNIANSSHRARYMPPRRQQPG